MPRSYSDVDVPKVPAEAAAATWAEGTDVRVERDWQNAQSQRFPTRALSWNAHDADLQSIVNQYNTYLSGTPGYRQVDWHLIKAILFVETNPTDDF